MATSPPSDESDIPEPRERKRAFTLERDFGERAAEINDLYNSFTGRQRTMDEYRWEWRQAPEPGFIWVIVETETGRIVGHHGLVHVPIVSHGKRLAGARTENTIVDPAVRKKLFYPALEKRALAEALETFSVIYTVHGAGAPGKVRARLGYKPVGRWVAYLPVVGPDYMLNLLQRARSVLGRDLPDWLLRMAAALASWTSRLSRRLRRRANVFEVSETTSFREVADEIDRFWQQVSARYDTTVDRSIPFLIWRLDENPHLDFRIWLLRKQGKLQAVVIGHEHRLSGSSSLYVDDIVVADYEQRAFEAVLDALPSLAPSADSISLLTLMVDTPLYRALRHRYRLQTILLDRFADRLFDELLAYDRDGILGDKPWYVTSLVTEGMDTSR
jgi:hypothetical protein